MRFYLDSDLEEKCKALWKTLSKLQFHFIYGEEKKIRCLKERRVVESARICVMEPYSHKSTSNK